MDSATPLGLGASPPLADFGGAGRTLLFLHANGYPPDCYRPLLVRLREAFHVLAMALRPLWASSHPGDIDSWKPFSEDLVQLIDTKSATAIVAMGHSVGAITALRAALAAPARFSALILVEPVLLPPSAIFGWSLVRFLGLGTRVHPWIRMARGRRRSFDSPQQAYDGYRRRPVFRYLSDDALRAMVDGMLRADPRGGFSLAYSPEWESRVYETSVWGDWDLWKGLPGLQVPTLIIRGSESDTFWVSAARQVRAKNPAIAIKTIHRATHLVPLEHPDEVFDSVRTFVEQAARAPAQEE